MRSPINPQLTLILSVSIQFSLLDYACTLSLIDDGCPHQILGRSKSVISISTLSHYCLMEVQPIYVLFIPLYYPDLSRIQTCMSQDIRIIEVVLIREISNLGM